MCNKVMDLPLTTPCAHNFCKSCLLGCKDRNVTRCPSCSRDIYDLLLNPQVNEEMLTLIKSFQNQRPTEQKEVIYL
ncbi:putative transcription factor C2H2 family [Helianthus debilis subsp. tardiflorus]